MKTKEEIEILRTDALAGDAGAQNDLGCAYSSGDGVVKNLKEAFIWFERSAKQGNKYGQYNVGRYYQYGFGVVKNVQSAIEWYEKSALQGYGKAANMLGQIYEAGYTINETERILKRASGSNIKKNPREAFYWYSLGSSYDEGLAKYNLARCYELGIGTPVVLTKALELYADCGKSEQEMQEKWDNIFKYYNPSQSERIRALNMFNQNPFRILGIWSNSSEKEIRAIKSRMDALLKVGKEIEIQNDCIIPSNIQENLETCENNKEYAQQRLKSAKESYKYIWERSIDNAETDIDWWLKVKEKEPDWKMIPARTSVIIEDAIRMLSSDECRVKHALFWFCKVSTKDDKCINLLLEHKWDEADDLWDEEESFSSLINQSVLYFIDGKDNLAISRILTVIHNDILRQKFLAAVTSGRKQITESELSHLFWDEIFEFPDAQYSTLVFFHQILNGEADSRVKEAITESDIAYIQNKCFEKLKESIDSIILKIDSCQDDDFSKKYDAFLQLISIAKEDLKWIRRFFSEEYYRYRLLCDDVANRILSFAIHYNNDNKENWNAPDGAKYLASEALNIAIDTTLRERCEKNLDIFKNNYRIVQTEKSIEFIDNKLEKIKGVIVSSSDLESTLKSVVLGLEILRNQAGRESSVYLNESSRIVNIFLDKVINICNISQSFFTYSGVAPILKQLQKMDMIPETKERLERNIKILSNQLEPVLGMCAWDRVKDTIEKNGIDNLLDTDIKIRAPKTVFVGDQFRVSFEIKGEVDKIVPPKVNNLTLISGPSSSKIKSTIYGQKESNRTGFTFLYHANSVGVATIGEVSSIVDGKCLTSHSFTIQVKNKSIEQSSTSPNLGEQIIESDKERDLWLACSQSGTYEIYIQQFPNGIHRLEALQKIKTKAEKRFWMWVIAICFTLIVVLLLIFNLQSII